MLVITGLEYFTDIKKRSNCTDKSQVNISHVYYNIGMNIRILVFIAINNKWNIIELHYQYIIVAWLRWLRKKY